MQQMAILAALAGYFVFLFHMLKKNRLNLRYTLVWFLTGLVMCVLALFPRILTCFSVWFGFEVPANTLFSFLFFFMFIILISLTTIVSKQNESIKRLVQYVALLDKQIRDMAAEAKQRNHSGEAS